MKRYLNCLLITAVGALLLSCCGTPTTVRVDLLITGGGASGTAAGLQAARMHCRTLIVEETPWLGGMLTAAGVSATDGNYRMPGGVWGEFRDALAAVYGGLDSLKTGWVSHVLFEPSVGNRIFNDMVSKEPNLEVWFEASPVSFERQDGKWIALIRTAGTVKRVEATVLIDATELGDVAAQCGVPYNTGMESRDETKEPIAPAQANAIVQDLTCVAILKDYGRDVTIPRPEGYDSTVFACTCASPVCIAPKEPNRLWSLREMITYGKLPNNKYMINWPVEGNDYYVNLIEMTPDERREALQDAKRFTMQFLYFIQHQLGLNTLGLADDEYPTADRLPFIPYHRESRRIVGKVRFTLPYITAPYTQQWPLYRTNIAVGDYPVDHHHARYTGTEELPDLHFSPIPSYGLPLGVLIPEATEGLIVAEKSISVSNIVNGTTRLQPVVLQIGQAAGALAALAVQTNTGIDAVPVRDVQQAILDARGYLMPYLDVPVSHPLFKTYQRIGATGILKGTGQSIGWSNETWLRIDEPLLAAELDGLKDFYPQASLAGLPDTVTLHSALALVRSIAKQKHIDLDGEEEDGTKAQLLFAAYKTDALEQPNAPMTRGEFARLVDGVLNPFHRKPIDLQGRIMN